MLLTVADIVHAPHLGLELLAEGDLSQPVRWVHATDQPNPAPYLRGSEIVLTDGLWLAGGTTPTDYVRRLADVNVAAIGFGLIEGQPPPPPALVRACRRRRVTLFAVPIEVPFLAISELFVDHMIKEREEPLRRTLQRSERLLDAVSRPEGATRVLAVLHSELGLDLWLCDRSGSTLAHAGLAPDGDLLAATADRAWIRFRVPGPGGTDAHLGVRRVARPLTVDEQTAIQQALTVLSIDAGHREALRQTHRRFAAELFELAREAEARGPAIAQRMRGLGLEPDGGSASRRDRPRRPSGCSRRVGPQGAHRRARRRARQGDGPGVGRRHRGRRRALRTARRQRRRRSPGLPARPAAPGPPAQRDDARPHVARGAAGAAGP